MENEIVNNNQFMQLYNDTCRGLKIIYFAWLLLCCFVSYIFYFSSSINLQIMFFYVILVVHYIKRSRDLGKSCILSLDMILLYFYTLFHMGYVTIFSMKIVPYFEEIAYLERLLPRSLFAVNIGLISFIYGYSILYIKNVSNRIVIEKPNQIYGIIGSIFIISGFIFHILGIFMIGLDTLYMYGYDVVGNVNRYTTSTLNILLLTLGIKYFMVLGVVIYCSFSALANGKLFKNKAIFSVVAFTILLLLVEGDRGPVVRLVMPAIIIRHFFIKRLKIKYLIVILFLIIFIFNAVSLTRKYGFNVDKMVKTYSEMSGSGDVKWYQPLLETGGSIKTVSMTIESVPEQENFWHGASWRDAVIHLVPFLMGYTFEHGWSTWAPSDWVTVTYRGTNASGLGFTAVAEGYLNFGYIGVFFELAFIGLFIKWLQYNFFSNPSVERILIMLGCFGTQISVIRAELSVATGLIGVIFIVTFAMKLTIPKSNSTIIIQ